MYIVSSYLLALEIICMYLFLKDMEEASDDEEDMIMHRKMPHPPHQPPPPPGPPPPKDNLPPLPPTPDQVIIRKNYDPKGKHTITRIEHV